jgi:hypothetical protein
MVITRYKSQGDAEIWWDMRARKGLGFRKLLGLQIRAGTPALPIGVGLEDQRDESGAGRNIVVGKNPDGAADGRG